ncbi:substrate-binding domain-containing protein [Yoonia sp. BS5-3]|uniref:Substrate-binding domain-containing protein n=1 Tax=Yoonia phaeophyticola TaxID=3137369 RepID=A0ABZ2V1Q9_9RHOB
MDMKHLNIKAALLGTAMCCASVAAAQEVNLKSPDGSIDLTGELIEYQDNIYVISSPLGSVRVSGDRVECVGGGCPDTEVLDQEITFSGSDAIADGLLPVLLASYATSLEAEPVLTETVGSFETSTQFIDNFGFGDLIESYRIRASVSSDAFMNLLGKSAEIGVSSRRITVDEARLLREYGAGSMVSTENEHILATDSIIVISNPSNPIQAITLEQLAGIYSGAISNWSELGGNDAPINAVHLARGSGTRGVFEERILQDTPGQPINVVEAEGSVDMAARVNADENAIGYVSIAFRRGAQAMSLTNECGIATEPDEFAAKTGEYVLQRPLYFYTRGDTTTDEVRDFLTWAKSGEATAAVAKSGFIDLGVSAAAQEVDSLRAQNLQNANLDDYEASFADTFVDQMVNYDRLSSTFRFFTGSNRLTPQSRVVLDRLIDYLEDQPAGEVMLVGFTDDQGPFDANLRIAEDRAAFMVEEIASVAGGRLDHITFTTAGYGELAPVACNATSNGRAINRRIEVWAAK